MTPLFSVTSMPITPSGTPTSLSIVLAIPYSIGSLHPARHPQWPRHTTHTPLHHSSGSRSSLDVSLAPSHLAPTCEWCTLPGLGSDHLHIDINFQLAPFTTPTLEPQPSTSKKAHWDEFKIIHQWAPSPFYRGNAEYPLRSSIFLLAPLKCSQSLYSLRSS